MGGTMIEDVVASFNAMAAERLAVRGFTFSGFDVDKSTFATGTASTSGTLWETTFGATSGATRVPESQPTSVAMVHSNAEKEQVGERRDGAAGLIIIFILNFADLYYVGKEDNGHASFINGILSSRQLHLNKPNPSNHETRHHRSAKESGCRELSPKG